jgi:hypothetical protein
VFVGRLDTHPVRQELAAALAGRSDVRIVDRQKGTRAFVRATAAAWIGLAPRGYGGSSFRFYEAAQLGTAPMLVGDLDTRPFPATIDWDSASLYAPTAADAVAFIDAADEKQLAAMGQRAAALWREDLTWGRWCHHLWSELQRRA